MLMTDNPTLPLVLLGVYYLCASEKRNGTLSANSRSIVDDHPLCDFQTVS